MMFGKIKVIVVAIALTLCAALPATALAASKDSALTTGVYLTTQDESDAYEGGSWNPYPKYNYEEGRDISCTWYVWDYAYNKLGIRLPGTWDKSTGAASAADPGWGNAEFWYGKAQADHNYQVGQEPRVNSIAVYSGGDYGHVEIVTSVDAGTITVNSGGYMPNGRYDSNLWNTHAVIEGLVKAKSSLTNLIGYIYLEQVQQDNPMTATASDKSLKASAVKSAAKAVSPFKAEGAVGAVTYADTSKSKYVTVGPDGKVTVRKGTPAGTYTVTAHVEASGDSRYRKGEADASAKVQVVSPPAAPSILNLKVKALAAGFSASWKKSSRAQGYEVGYYTAKQKSAGRSIADAGSSTSKKVTGLKAQTAYSVEVRAYASAVDGKKYYSGWSGPLIVKTKKNSYTVSFVANGGKGAMKAQTVNRGKSVKLKANKFTRSGYKFAGWNTKKNGKGKSYANKAAVKNLAKAGKTVKLYAQWKKSSSALSLAKAKKIYSSALKSLRSKNYRVYYKYADVIGDKTVELVAYAFPNEGMWSHDYIYTINSGKPKLIFDRSGYGQWSNLTYRKDSKSLVYYGSGHGGDSYLYLKFSGGKYKAVAWKARSWGSSAWSYSKPSGAAMITVSESAFNKIVTGLDKGDGKVLDLAWNKMGAITNESNR